MDLNLRKGNCDRYEFAFQTGMIGAEVSAEGPLKKDKGSSFLVNARYANFNILSSLNLIDLGSTNYAPRSQNIVFNVNLPGKRNGNINLFGFHGSSSIGKKAVRDTSSWENDSYHHNYSYPSAILSFLLNSKLSPGNVFRTGINIQLLGASMDQWRVKNMGRKEVLVNPSGSGIMYEFYFQFKVQAGKWYLV